MDRRSFIHVSLLTMAVALTGPSAILYAIAQQQGAAPDPQLPPRDSPWMSQLTDDQKTEIQQLTQSMKDAGASPQKIGDAVNAKLQEWGIQPPECSGGQPTDSTRPLRDPPWMSRLTDDQKTQIQQLIQTMKDSGATPQNIRDAINSKLQEWGIELPVPPQRPGP